MYKNNTFQPFTHASVCKPNNPKGVKKEIIFPVRLYKNKNETNGYHIMQFNDRSKTGFTSWKDVTLEGDFNMDTESSTPTKDYDLKEYEEQRRKKYGMVPKNDISKAEKWKINVNNNGCEHYKGEMTDQDTENCVFFVAERNVCSGGLVVRQITNWYNFEEHTSYTGHNVENAAMQYRNRKRAFNYFASKLQHQAKAITERERAIKKTKVGGTTESYDFDEKTGVNEKENDSDNEGCFKNIKKGSQPSNDADNIEDIAKRNDYYGSSSEETSEFEAFYYGKTMYKKLNSKQKKRKRKAPSKVQSTPVEDNNIDEFFEATTSYNTPSDSEYVPEWDFCEKDEEYAVIEEAVKRYLKRKPMTLMDLLKKIIRKKDNTIPGDNVVALIADIIRKLGPQKRKINGKVYLSLDEDVNLTFS
ncbi:general transcription factor IIF subunit 1-like isoform X1 [Teleopsis dalmanni]|uniref:general transcription factor IIF subunit 1-like isoform X1 n=2 Tax=Teleopsis dalmanni TaxID=139649 RepID=UPI0018CD37C8|nr:general transcription factor IIF subunit 1-like isoform X1 [Teleopsis dalmanni]